MRQGEYSPHQPLSTFAHSDPGSVPLAVHWLTLARSRHGRFLLQRHRSVDDDEDRNFLTTVTGVALSLAQSPASLIDLASHWQYVHHSADASSFYRHMWDKKVWTLRIVDVVNRTEVAGFSLQGVAEHAFDSTR